MPEQQQIARIDRHAEMIDRAAGRLDRGRDHIAAVDDRRGAVDQEQIDPSPIVAAISAARSLLLCAQRRLERQGATERIEPALRHLAGFVEDRLLETRQPRLDQSDASDWNAATRNSLPPSAAIAAQRATVSSGTANGMILTVAAICLGSTTA